MRRTVATLLVVASPLLLANPVSASGSDLPGRGAAPAVAPATPAPVQTATPAAPAPVADAATGVPAPALDRVTAPAAPSPVRHALKNVRAKAPAPAPALADLEDAAYTARLQAQLCQARQIFCGLDRSGRYPAG